MINKNSGDHQSQWDSSFALNTLKQFEHSFIHESQPKPLVCEILL